MLSKQSNHSRLILLGILLVAVLLRLIYFTGCIGSDDLSHNYSAYTILKGNFDPTVSYSNIIATMRLGVAIPVAGFFYLFGVNEISSVLFPLTCSFLCILLIYHFGRTFFDQKTGLIAAFLLALTPLHIFQSSILLATLPLMLTSALVVFFFMKASEEENKKKAALYFFLAGLFLGLLQSIKLTGLQIFLLLGICILYKLCKKEAKIQYLCIIPGFLIPVIGEMVLWYLWTDDPLYRYKVIKSIAINYTTFVDKIIYGYGGLSGKLLKFKKWGRYLFAWDTALGLPFYLIAIAIPYCINKKLKWCGLLTLWVAIDCLYIFNMIWSYPSVQPRYTLQLFFPAILLLSVFFSRNRIFQNKNVSTGLIICLTAGLLFGIVKHKVVYTRNKLYTTRAAFAHFEDKQWTKPVYTDPLTYQIFNFFAGFETKSCMHAYPSGYLSFVKETDVDLNTITQSYVAIDWRLIHWLERRVEFSEAIYAPPQHWKLEKVIRHPENRGDIYIYYVGKEDDVFWEAKDVNLPNSDFELADEENGSLPVHWSAFSYGKNNRMEWELTDDAKVGERSCYINHITGKESWLISGKGRYSKPPSSQLTDIRYEILPNSTYRIEAWISSEPEKPVDIYFFEYNKQGRKKSTLTRRFKLAGTAYEPHTQEAYGENILVTKQLDSMGTFQKVHCNVITGNDAKEYRIGFRLTKPGKTVIDGIKLTHLSEKQTK